MLKGSVSSTVFIVTFKVLNSACVHVLFVWLGFLFQLFLKNQNIEELHLQTS